MKKTMMPTTELTSKMVGFYRKAEQNARDETIEWLVDEYLRQLPEDREHYDRTALYVFGKNSVIYDEFSRLVEDCK